MGKVGPMVRALRIALLLAALCGALHLYLWSQSADPRFYRFVKTVPGRHLARIFRWYGFQIESIPEEKPEEQMTERELAIKRNLEKKVADDTPSARLVLNGGKEMLGKVLEEDGDSITFLESYGDSGSLSVKIRRNRIERIEKVEAARPEITYKDLRFAMEFPHMQLYKRPPYTILTDESFFHVERSVRVLQQLHEEFMASFGPLLQMPRRKQNIQLLFFSDERSFQRYQRKYAPHMEGVLGFYSPWLDRFILYNEAGSDRIRDLAGDTAANPAAASSAAEVRKRRAQRSLLHAAEESTFTTLRHEGAHQLFFTYGVHSSCRVENDWLVEGLAVYCEDRGLGVRQPGRIAVLKKKSEQGALIPLADLVNFRDAKGFMGIGDPERIDLAYHEAWAVVRFLMEGVRRDAFFNYIRYIRDTRNLEEVLKVSPMDLLCRYAGKSPADLEKEWLDYVARL